MQRTLEEFLTSESVNLMEKRSVEVKPQYTYMNWFRFREEFRKFTAEEDPADKPDIIYIRATEELPPPGMDIQHIVRCLKKDCIVITNAMCIRGHVAPLAFPGDSVIAVGRKGDKVHGSTQDFVIEPYKQAYINSIDTSIEVEDKHCKDTLVEAEEEKISLLGQKSNKEESKITIEEPQESGSTKSKDDQANKVKGKKGKGAGKGKKGKGEEENIPLVMLKNKYPKHAAETSASSEAKDDEAETAKKPSDKAEKRIPWEASLEAVGIAAVILLKAQYLRK